MSHCRLGTEVNAMLWRPLVACLFIFYFLNKHLFNPYSQYKTLKHPSQQAAALRAESGLDDVDEQGEEDDARGQIVEEV